jgi:hypothetical protein
LRVSAPRAGLRPARPPWESSKVAEPHLLERRRSRGRGSARPVDRGSKSGRPRRRAGRGALRSHTPRTPACVRDAHGPRPRSRHATAGATGRHRRPQSL